MGYIYKITNTVNGKIYIGKTLHDVNRRFLEHKYEAHTDTKNRPFHKAIVKYGIENFSIETLEDVDLSMIDEREKFWISHYRSYIGFEDSNGYNATLGGDGTTKINYAEIVKDYLNTASKDQTARNLKCCVETVRKACDEFGVQTISKCGGRQVQRVSGNGEIKEYATIAQAAKDIALLTGKSQHSIRTRITCVINRHKKAKGLRILLEHPVILNSTAQCDLSNALNVKCRHDGIGRLDGLKNRWWKRRVGSSSTADTAHTIKEFFT